MIWFFCKTKNRANTIYAFTSEISVKLTATIPKFTPVVACIMRAKWRVWSPNSIKNCAVLQLSFYEIIPITTLSPNGAFYWPCCQHEWCTQIKHGRRKYFSRLPPNPSWRNEYSSKRKPVNFPDRYKQGKKLKSITHKNCCGRWKKNQDGKKII